MKVMPLHAGPAPCLRISYKSNKKIVGALTHDVGPLLLPILVRLADETTALLSLYSDSAWLD
jgi:hypothetical protein